ncbi:MAG: chromosome partitioning protein ParA [Deltaproteobacteria bacterium HGW-Deltaproteobacteria-21]|jgi:chromosome partitioning protein|nr:MAG: chromosome partitioning protein ParA [Deltaproteobacteria bacterium HGW-Deltaproteobacteria-21]PKN64267.1 MAG: chromosome partitioning protein ParA [Deltaproteobacteria bacterium HGW-Deltaproteobacteria-15]
MGHVIAVVNQKGGVGKTTTAVNLSASLAVAEKKCLLVDCDPQGNATTGLGLNRTELEKGVYDLLIASIPLEEAVTTTGLPGLDLLPATPNLIGAEVEIVSMAEREYLLKKGLAPSRRGYDFILLDCPPSLGFLTINALAASDSVLVPLQCEYYALEGITQLLKTIKAVKQGLNPSLHIAGILLTMFDSRNNLSLQVAEEARTHFGDTVFRTIIPRNVRLSESPSHGKPAILYDIKSTGAQSYLALAKELISRGSTDHG